MREVAVIGVAQSRFGKLPDISPVELGREAVLAALKDAGMKPRSLQVAYGCRCFDGSTSTQAILKEVGVTGIEMVNVENACASGSTAFRGVWKEIADGHFDIGIAIGLEHMTSSPVASKLIPPSKEDFEGHLGSTMPSIFAMIARRQMEQYGTTL